MVNENEWDSFSRSKAEKHRDMSDRAIHLRVSKYAGDKITIDNKSSTVSDLVYWQADHIPEELMHKLVKSLLSKDDSALRTLLRSMELAYLATI